MKMYIVLPGDGVKSYSGVKGYSGVKCYSGVKGYRFELQLGLRKK